MDHMIKLVFLTSMFALVTACSSPTVKEEASTEFATEGLHAVKSSGFEEAYILPSADLASYRSVTIEPLDLSDVNITNTAVQGTVRRDWAMTPERVAGLQQGWQSSTDRAFGDYDLEGGGDKVLRMTSALTKVQPGMGSMGTTTAVAGTQPIQGPGGDSVDISAEFRLYDQASGDLIAVIRDRRRISAQQWSRTSGADMASVFNSWAGLLHTRVSGK
jgi:hypothetical protein